MNLFRLHILYKEQHLIVNTEKKQKTKVIVLRPKTDELEIQEIVNKKKAKMFRHFLKTPKPEEVHVHSLLLIYEPLMILSGTYNADFLRKSIHEVRVDRNVSEIIFGEGIFPASNFDASSSSKKIGSKIRKNTVPLELEEHVFVSEEKELVLDHHGKPRDFRYKVDAKDVENYPNQVLKKNSHKEFEITEDAAIKRLVESLQSHDTIDDIRDLNENLVVHEVTMIYVPIYEARLIGPKKKVEILRFDAIKNKLL